MKRLLTRFRGGVRDVSDGIGGPIRDPYGTPLVLFDDADYGRMEEPADRELGSDESDAGRKAEPVFGE